MLDIRKKYGVQDHNVVPVANLQGIGCEVLWHLDMTG